MYLQEAKDYSIIVAGSILGWAKLIETAGAVSSGFVSDFLFRSRRNIVALLYGLVKVVGLLILFMAPSTHLFNLDTSWRSILSGETISPELRQAFIDHQRTLPAGAQLVATGDVAADDQQPSAWVIKCRRWTLGLSDYTIVDTGRELRVGTRVNFLHVLGASMFGFGLGGLLVFLGGLMAVDLSSKKATGAAMGLIGVFSYLGAAIQEWISGGLIEAGKTVVDGQTTHDFSSAITFWVGAAMLAVLLSSTLWKAKVRG
jgi:sugar phosphate permease